MELLKKAGLAFAVSFTSAFVAITVSDIVDRSLITPLENRLNNRFSNTVK